MSNLDHKCGTVALIGLPNAGKSTLLNALVRYPVAITAKMAGTTRSAIRGILHTDTAQIIFVDTPGMQNATNLLERQMNRNISGAVKSADVLCFVVDVRQVTPEIIQKVANYRDFGVPAILALTKIDTAKPEQVLGALAKFKDLTFIKEFVPVSALKKIGLQDLIQAIVQYLPTGPAVYDLDTYTDSSARDMTAEIIRGEIINQLREEVPAGVKVIIKNFTTVARTTTIDADILCDKINHKKIIIGAQGQLLRQIGVTARQKLEKLLGQHVVLHTFVLVRENWRNQTEWLNQ